MIYPDHLIITLPPFNQGVPVNPEATAARLRNTLTPATDVRVVPGGISKLLAEYDNWQAERGEYAEAGGTPGGPTSSEWADSDDTGIELLHNLALLVRGHNPNEEA